MCPLRCRIVVFAPTRLKNCPSSTAITPPPSTASRFGIVVDSSAVSLVQ